MAVPSPAARALDRQPERPNLLGRDRSGLQAALTGIVDRDFRIDQLFRALYREGRRSFSTVSTLPSGLRAELEEGFRLELPKVEDHQESFDGTRKFLFTLEDGRQVEAVDIPDTGRNTFCLSSQAGCPLACRFCVTGYWGAGRDLRVEEIVGQALALQSSAARDWQRVNIVLMGMGEPLLNQDAVRRALEVLAEQVAWRRMTLSTAGVVPGIEAMMSWAERPNLAVSLHAPNDALRSRLMPINRKYPLDELFAVLRRYPTTRRSALTFEYTLIRDFNDSPALARDVARRIEGLQCKVNLIPMNPDPVFEEVLRPPEWSTVQNFQRTLIRQGVRCSVRRPMGDDIAAACGQLRASGAEPRGFSLPEPPLS